MAFIIRVGMTSDAAAAKATPSPGFVSVTPGEPALSAVAHRQLKLTGSSVQNFYKEDRNGRGARDLLRSLLGQLLRTSPTSSSRFRASDDPGDRQGPTGALSSLRSLPDSHSSVEGTMADAAVAAPAVNGDVPDPSSSTGPSVEAGLAAVNGDVTMVDGEADAAAAGTGLPEDATETVYLNNLNEKVKMDGMLSFSSDSRSPLTPKHSAEADPQKPLQKLRPGAFCHITSVSPHARAGIRRLPGQGDGGEGGQGDQGLSAVWETHCAPEPSVHI